MNDEENKIAKRHYKVEAGDEVTVYRNDVTKGDITYTFYKIPIQKKEPDGNKKTYYKNVAFKKGTDLKNETKIKIIDFFEDVFTRQNDRYNANWTLFITDFEEIKPEDKIMAIDEFNNLMNSNDDVEITDDMIAF